MTGKTCTLIIVSAAVLLPWLGGCTAPHPPITTFWDKMGVTFAYATARDNHLNKSGDRPWKEWKPPKLRLADPRNLESPNPAIKLAAEMKMAEDLADQKVKALKYMGMIGCGCYDKDKAMQNAFLDALHDCTPCVRLAAIEALQMSADQCNSQAQAFKALREDCDQSRRSVRNANRATRERRMCQGCAGNGCAACGGCGEFVVSEWGGCGSCGGSGCGACGSYSGYACESCLGKEICKRLEEMANKQDDDGCWLEPVAEIRAAAAQLLSWCPPPEPEPIQQQQRDIEGETEGAAAGTDAYWVPVPNGFMPISSPNVINPAWQGQGYNPTIYQTPWSQQQPAATNWPDQGPVGSAINPNYPGTPLPANQSIIAAPVTTPAPSSVPIVSARAASSPTFHGQILAAREHEVAIQFEKAYRLPDGAKLLVTGPDGSRTEMTVIASDTGVVMAQADTSGATVDNLRDSWVEVGVLSK